jgi:hypothetical protein
LYKEDPFAEPVGMGFVVPLLARDILQGVEFAYIAAHPSMKVVRRMVLLFLVPCD